ncbi:hypothetical protein ACFWUZ_08805 [Streptomyces sp. NPDC058646]|uniref:hypothetical protein n=1 Tax=Streptomyces sp. NPDC058646 TaxID=3346574 RepID=UPI0036498B62
MTASITALDAAGLRAHREELAALLLAVVESGSSLGFLTGLDHEGAAAWWDSLLPAVEDGSLALWVSRTGGDGRIDGTVSWCRESKSNGRHRAELRKLMVHPAARGRGTARPARRGRGRRRPRRGGAVVPGHRDGQRRRARLPPRGLDGGRHHPRLRHRPGRPPAVHHPLLQAPSGVTSPAERR